MGTRIPLQRVLELIREGLAFDRITRDQDFDARVFVQASGPSIIYLRILSSTLQALHMRRGPIIASPVIPADRRACYDIAMHDTLHIHTRVLPGSRVEVTAPQLREGETVEVILMRPDAQASNQQSALDIIESLKGHRLFANARDISRHLDEERSSWDR